MATLKCNQVLCFVEEETNPRASEEFQFKLLVPTLEDTVSATLVLSLWQRRFAETTSKTFDCERVRDIMSDVYDTLFSLSLKYFLKRKLFRRNEQVAREVYLFCRHLIYTFELPDISWCQFSDVAWYPRGTINYAKTIEMIINCDELRGSNRFVIAASYGFENMVTEMAAEANLPLDDYDLRYDVLYSTNRVFQDRQHSVMLTYWEGDNEKRRAIVDNWLNESLKWHRLQDICFLLARLSERMLQQVLVTWEGKLLEKFAYDIFQEDYFWQIATLLSKVVDHEYVDICAKLPFFSENDEFVLQDVKSSKSLLKSHSS